METTVKVLWRIASAKGAPFFSACQAASAKAAVAQTVKYQRIWLSRQIGCGRP